MFRSHFNVLLTTVGLTACSASPSDDSSATGTDTGATDTDTDTEGIPEGPSAGCGLPVSRQGTVTSLIDVNGVTRSYVLKFPQDYDPNIAYPLVFSWHGHGDNSDNFSSIWQGHGQNLIAVTPQGLPLETGLAGWDSTRDLVFFDALYEVLTANLCVDRSRVFSLGFSNGGGMTYGLSCGRADVVRGASIVGAAPSDPSLTVEDLDELLSDCPPLPTWLANGIDDPLSPIEGAEVVRDWMLNRNGCDPDASTATGSGLCVRYDDCTSGAPLEYCPYDGAHVWLPNFVPDSVAFFLDVTS